MNTTKIALNADIGESFGAWQMGADDLLMPHIDWANIACGFHASDPLTMLNTVKLAKQHEVVIGAHPAYPDLVGFGRRHMACKPDEITAMVQYQVGALQAIAAGQGTTVDYVKPHGALYNDMLSDGQTFDAVCAAVAALQQQRSEPLPLMIMATPENHAWQQRAETQGITLIFEGFADRAYDQHGHLVSRRQPGAVHEDPKEILAQAITIAKGEPLTASDGSKIVLQADTLCVHGDNNESIAAIQSIREAIQALGSQT